ncbi:hypothetical protein NXX31_25985 [Bacteroides thetaiotaomicron]|nr:hypothetical protein [Bacteroides thetaiotaomicron]MCS3332052.1 hypothetical protein [Bacteroides thetaiotaomicron]
MKIYKKKELPRHEEEEFSVIVLTCDEHGETNLGFYNFDTEDWSFLSEADQSYRDSEFVWIYPPADQMKEFLIKSIKAERESAPPSSKENWFRKKTQPIKKKITLAFKKKKKCTFAALTKAERKHWKIKDTITSKNGQTRSVTEQVYCLES